AVKPLSADGSVGLPHARVGHRQAFLLKPQLRKRLGFFYGYADAMASYYLPVVVPYALVSVVHGVRNH
ncbi:hypothetical protein, partial [Chromohalobacter canadensis]|uniref:hypothetical protein n=1 Tax=Chromohalobacter canadensis TaxID=141389 RepID=UPI00240F7669